jgi:hypothetical protein
MSETKKKPLKTRCYYTDYVNHAIRFFLSTPGSLQTEGKRKADIDNWVSVQAIYHCLTDADKEKLTTIFKLHYRLPEGVRLYCESNNADPYDTWVFITKVSAAIAKRRGLV